MKRVVCALGAGLAAVFLFATTVAAQSEASADTTQPTTTTIPPPPPQPPPSDPPQVVVKEKRVYYGGTLGVAFGEPTRVGIFPMIGFKATKKLSFGGKIGYEYLKYDNIDGFNNYGGSLFTRYRPVPRLYGHAEYQWISTEFVDTQFGENDRDVVPYLLVGGGLVQPISPTTAGYVEVLFDVIQDENSPYDSGEPIINFGVTVGF